MPPKRELDLLVYGATGFTGQLVAEYLVERYGAPDEKLRWGLAGRSLAKLESVRDALGAPAQTPLVVADADDAGSLRAMAERTRCVLTTVGPYTWYGAPLVEACVESGTDYVDLAGEVLWMREMIERHSARARETGARIVHSTGFDSIPFDHGVLFLQEAARERFGSPCERVRARVVDLRGTLSGGTAASARATAEAAEKDPSLIPHLLDPFSLCEGFAGPAQPDLEHVALDEVAGGWIAPFFMAVINTKNVHRSNALMEHAYGRDFQYDEMFLTGPGEEGEQAAQGMAAMSTAVRAGSGGPEPGQGPSREEREAGGYDVLFIGSHASGGEIRARVTGDRDPGYGSTSKIIAEAAICLASECADTPGGVWTPAAALGTRLIPRLVERAGLTFDLVDA